MKQQILKFLRSQHLMSLATAKNNKPWSNTAYFAADNDLNLYFVSPPSADHSKYLSKNKYIACSIYDSRQKVNSQKEGLQLKGTVSIITKVPEIKKALKLWNQANPGAAKIINYDNMVKKVISSKIYKISPTLFKYFNETLYGDKETKTYKLSR